MDNTEEADVINNHPIVDRLVAFCNQFKSSQARLGMTESLTAVKEALSAESGLGKLESCDGFIILLTYTHYEVDQQTLKEFTGCVYDDTFLGGLHYKYHTSANRTLRGLEADRNLDMFLVSSDSNILVIGEHKQNLSEDRSIATLVQLTGYTRKVFGSQPDRRFVSGFTIYGSLLRLWVFDKFGAYSSERFDIHKNPERFVKVITGYTLMTEAELGLNTFINRDRNSKYIITRDTKIHLENQPIASQKAVEYVIKLAWPLLKLATEREVTGITQWFYHKQVVINEVMDTVTNLRNGLEFGQPRKISAKACWVYSATESSRADSKTRSNPRGRSQSSMRRLTCLAISTRSSSTSSRQKRKQDEQLTYVEQDTKEDESRKPDSPSIQEPDVGEDSETYGNRVHCCLVVSPTGRPLHTYRSVKELLEVFRNAIAGHRSLLEDGKILHRDVSENNIIITEPAAEGDLRGRLIDLDLGKELDSAPSGASHRTGAMQFMAIEVLQGKGHTYRHNLESHFSMSSYGYTGGGIGKAKVRRSRLVMTSRLRGWYMGTYTEIGRNKLGDMDENGFEDIVAELALRFENQKQLAREPRSILFPIRDGAIFTGTFRNNDIMYNGMINSFDKAINHLDKE
ncbi:hypothetical protein F5884DRAFT_869681 [Xylogone sp. PMI_703]|nr:hypothetical protein F5884DRAFT_869681 [Xylogone sp. PMI_703]